VRAEIELPITAPPAGGEELLMLLSRHGIDRLIRQAGIDDPGRLHAIGELRNDRSRHTYVRGLLRLELTWDRLEYPIGRRETRVEVEAKSRSALRYLTLADEELRRLFADDLDSPRRGKVKELCARLYPELV